MSKRMVADGIMFLLSLFVIVGFDTSLKATQEQKSLTKVSPSRYKSEEKTMSRRVVVCGIVFVIDVCGGGV